jgi:hypothetical protein
MERSGPDILKIFYRYQVKAICLQMSSNVQIEKFQLELACTQEQQQSFRYSYALICEGLFHQILLHRHYRIVGEDYPFIQQTYRKNHKKYIFLFDNL